MRAGSLNHRVSIEQLGRRQDQTGEPVETWVPAGERWMGKRDLRAAERFTGVETIAEVETVFKARFEAFIARLRPDTHRLVFRGTVYNILGIAEVGRRDAIEIACSSRAEAKYVSPDV